MSGDIEQRLRTELQRLLDQNLELEPVQFHEGTQIVTVSVADGIPQIARSDFPSPQTRCPHIDDLHGSPAYHIYNLMQSLRCLDDERLQQGAAHILTLTPVAEVEGARLENPQLPSRFETVNSTMDGACDLHTRPRDNGMLHHLELLQKKFAEMLARHPDLEPLVLQTPRGAVEIRLAGQRLFSSPSPLGGRPYADVQETPQVRTYVLHKTIQGLEAALYGESNPLEVTRPIHRNKAEENLLRQLRQTRCDKLVVPIRRSRKNLYISGPAREMTYLPLRIRIADERLCIEEQVQREPSGHARVEYRALPADLKPLLNAFFAYLSSRISNGIGKH